MSDKTRQEPEDALKRHTPESVAEVVAESMEPQTAEEVLEALKKIDGQPITTRLLDKLPGGRVEWRLSRQLGWTEIKNRAYVNSSGASPQGICLMLARSEASVPLNAAWVERENPAYFAGRRERNALRAKALGDKQLLTRAAFLFNELEDINAVRKAKTKEFAVLVEHGEPLSPVKYRLERVCGLREDEKK